MLSKLRDDVITFNLELANALLATVDAVRYMLGQIEETGEPGTRDFTHLIDLLTRLNDDSSVETDLVSSPATSVSAVAVPALQSPAAEKSNPWR